MEPTAIIGIVTGLACCGFMGLLLIGLAVFLLRRNKSKAAPAAAPAAVAEGPVAPQPAAAPAPQPVAAPAPQPVAAPAPQPVAAPPPATPPGMATPQPGAPNPYAPPAVPADPSASAPMPQRPAVPDLPPIDENDEDPTVLARPQDLGIRPTATQPHPPDPAASAPWQAPTQRVTPRPAPSGRPVPPPAPDQLPPQALRPGATIIPDDDLIDELEGDETVLMPRIPRRRLDDDDQ